VAVEASDEVPAVLVAEGDGDVLGGHLKLVDHAPAGEVPGGEVEAAFPAGGGPDGLPVVGAGAWGPVLAAQRDEAELSLARQAQEHGAGVCGQRSPAHAAFGQAIRELREERDISQEAFALKSGIDRSHYGGMERGERNPSLTSVSKIANALGVQPSNIHARAEQIQATNAPR
jgi:DNA-binding XRE family transcriptional regulator